MTSDSSNHRQFTRVEPELEVDLKTSRGRVLGGRVQDLSMNGLFVQISERLMPGTSLEVTAYIGGRYGGIQLHFGGTVVRMSDGGVAVEISDIPVNAFEHIRNLVLCYGERESAAAESTESEAA